MALIQCKACGAKVSRDAAACPQCGHPPPKRTSWVTWIVLVGVGYLAVQCSAMMDASDKRAAERAAQMSPAQQEAEERQRKAARYLEDARVNCELAIRKFLRHPPSAKFEDLDTAQLVITGTRGTITTLVRAQNSFGAIVPQRFRGEGEVGPAEFSVSRVVGL